MNTLSGLCTPRQSVFDTQRRDTTLDLTDLISDSIDAAEFFTENYVTEGMRTLLEQGFKRLEGKSEQGVFLLKQAMGGGKTHNLLTFGLLAKHPEVRARALEGLYTPDSKLGAVKVVAFSGRESDAPLGVWGAIASQLGKTDHFKDSYSPLRAPGQTAWENLFAGETVLILLDELPPYFDSAESQAIGNSDLSRVTATALSNLLVAIGRESCSRVCLVMTDLSASYERGSQHLREAITNFQNEAHRTATPLEPVRMNSDELYHILRTRLFETLPEAAQIESVAQDYAKAVRDAGQMAITSENPEQFADRVRSSYPFHPAIRDLYARFRENPGFQQTRGLIRLMRAVTASLYSSGRAASRSLIAAHDLDLNDEATRTEIMAVNGTLTNAIAHDVASGGTAVAEVMDQNIGSTDATDVCKLLLLASLANVPNAVLGLSIPEAVAYLCAPGRDLARLKGEVLEKLATAAWYLHSNRDGKLYFKNVENLNAKLESLVKTYANEQAVKELRLRLEELFKAVNGWCYQRVLPLPAVDEIELDQNRVTLVIAEPYTGGLQPDLRAFWDQATWKNRVCFLTGAKQTYSSLIDTGKRLKAVQHILGELRADKVQDNDPQLVQALDLQDKTQANFLSAVRETFTVLWYPADVNGEASLSKADFLMKFEGNKYSGEGQVLDVLRQKAKFTDDISGEIFRKKCEQRLFTQQSMPWTEVKKRAATNAKWPWHKIDALDALKAEMVHQDVWRDEGGFVDKGPFPQPATGLTVQQQRRDDDTGKVWLRVTPGPGDTVHYEFGGQATTASAKLEGPTLETDRLEVSFLAVDSRGVHETGAPVLWRNKITLKHRVYQAGMHKRVELQAAPPATIRYTTDGSNPRDAGATYEGDFSVDQGAPFVLAYAERDGVQSEVERIAITWEKDEPVKVEPTTPATWRRRQEFTSTRESYDFLARLKKYGAGASELNIVIASGPDFVEVNTSEGKTIAPELIEACLEAARKVQTEGQVNLTARAVHFEAGQGLIDWVEDAKTQLTPGEVKQ